MGASVDSRGNGPTRKRNRPVLYAVTAASAAAIGLSDSYMPRTRNAARAKRIRLAASVYRRGGISALAAMGQI